MNAKPARKTPIRTAAFGALGLLAALSQPAPAALTDISNTPLAVTTSAQVKPNIMLLMDNSGSMDWDYMPDTVNDNSGTDKIGYKHFRCNTQYFNPAISYTLPKKPTGSNFTAASFTAAWDDGFQNYPNAATTTVNLSTSFKAHSADTSQPAYYYTYTGSQALVPSTSGACRNSDPNSTSTYGTNIAATGGGNWTKVNVVGTSDAQNFANWYSYYRNRISMMKSAASLAFVSLTNSYRVGFLPLHDNTTGYNYLPIADFDATQKASWFTTLFKQIAGSATPLREGLSKVGRHYAGKHDGINSGMAGDPVQYSCQQNFAIVTTDGYWNGNGGQKLDGSAMDNQDGDLSVAPRPMWDGGAGSSTTVTDQSNGYQYAACSISQRQQRTYILQKRTSSDSGSTWTAWAGATSCNVDSSGSNRTQCQFLNDTGWVNVASCSSQNPSSSNNYTNIDCQTLSGQSGQKIQYRTTTTATTTQYSGGVQIGSPATTTTGPTGWSDVTGTCYASNPPALPNPNPQRPAPTDPPAPPSGCSAWPCTSTSTGIGGSSNSLADVAQYYYQTDLRPAGSIGALGTDVSEDNVPSTGQGTEDDKASWQHMTTFTMGLGLSGTLQFRPDYKTATTGDFAQIRAGTKNWPIPAADSATAIDDLWHAAVDGRGQYFSASDPVAVVDGLTSALAGINARVSSAAAAATSNLEPVAGDNFAYTAKYTTTKWTGELEAHQINLTTGAVDPAVIWSAQTKLDAVTQSACDNRSIFLFRSGATNNLTNFSWNATATRCDGSVSPITTSPSTGLNATEQANFSSTQVQLLSQYPNMTTGAGGTGNTVDQRTAAAGENLVNYLRGQRGKEGFVANTANGLYRARDHVLGDIIDAQPVYVKAPFASYSDAGYSGFKTANAARTPMVFVAANDGMLHAFYAGTSLTDTQGGQEAWAFVPTPVLPSMYKLASEAYGNNHVFLVDASPSVGDVYDSTAAAWKTILVGGLNSGGRGYYALDVTNPMAPKGLWEFNSTTCPTCHIGYSYGNPILSKLADGRWVVFVTSGINNDDGIGYLYVLNAITGAVIYQISTNTGSAGTPSGLTKINNWVDNSLVDNTTQRVYGVDLLGNLWRFDVNDSIAPGGREATLVATAKDASGTAQPISTRPELALVGNNPFVFFATGRLIGSSDISDTHVQSIYGVQDTLGSTPYANLRTTLKQMTMTAQGSGLTATRTINCTVQCTSTSGWFVDLPDGGERVNVDLKLQLGTLVVASNVPQNTACTIGGYSWLNFLNYSTGGSVSTSTGQIVSQKLSDSLAVGMNIVRLPDGRTVVITTTSDAANKTVDAPFDTPGPAGKRMSWREIVQ